MATNTMTTGTSGLAGLYVTTYLEKRFVATLKKKLLAAKLGVDSTMGEGLGATTARWQYFTAPSAMASTSSLTEGSDTSAYTDQATTTAVATLAEYSGVTKFSRRLMRTALSGTLDKFSEMLGYQAALSIDGIVTDTIDASTTTVDSGATMTADSVRLGVRALEVNDAQPHSSTGGENFVGLFSADSLYDMAGEGAPTWAQAKNSLLNAAYQNPFKNTMPSAGLYNCLIFKTNAVQQASSNYNNLIIADESFGTASLDTNTMQPRIIPTWPDDNVVSPGRVYGFLAWWILYACALFDNNRVAVVMADV
jgi:N4-gp56 family major capsid protein